MKWDRGADWPHSWKRPDIMQRLRNGLESNDSSNVDADGLPVAVAKVLRNTPRRPADFL